MSRSVCFNTALATVGFAVLAGCSSLPAFGPNADAIMRAGADGATAVQDTVPFEIVEVTASTLPKTDDKSSLFPASFRSQQFHSEDEVIHEGDLLEILIWEVAEDGLFASAGNRETKLNVQVSNSGQISVPYAGAIGAQGLTTSDLRALLLERYHGRAVEPEIAVSVAGTDARSAILLGDVRNPGRATVPSRGIRLLDLIAQSGGANHAPWEIMISVQRGTASAAVSLADVIGNAANNIVILPGDTVNVAYEIRRFAVYGGVTRSSNIEIPKQEANLAYLLAEVGGLDERVAQAGSVFVFRPAADANAATAYRFDFSRPDAFLLASAFILKPTDIIYVASADAVDFQRFTSIIMSPLLRITQETVSLEN